MTDWWDTPYGWLMRHYQSNGMIVGTRYEDREAAAIKAQEAAREAELERVERLKRAMRNWKTEQTRAARPRKATPPRTWIVLRREQYLKRNRMVLILRIAGLKLHQAGELAGRAISRERVRQIVLKTQRDNRWLISRRKVTLDRYLFKAHGFGGRQYRLGA